MYPGKDTYAAGRLVQKLRKPTNRISQGKLLTKETAATAFHIGIDDVNKCANETIQLIKDGKHFAILMPISLTSEIARLENVDGQRVHDIETAKKVASMSKIVLASSSETWLVSCLNHFYNNDMEGLGMNKVQEIFYNSYHEMRASSIVRNQTNETVDSQLFVAARRILPNHKVQ